MVNFEAKDVSMRQVETGAVNVVGPVCRLGIKPDQCAAVIAVVGGQQLGVEVGQPLVSRLVSIWVATQS